MTSDDMPDEDSFVWLVRDIPNPVQYARAMLMTQRHLARELLAAHRTKDGWKYKYDPDPRLINELRSLGLADMPGDARAKKQSRNYGWNVTNFALAVRVQMVKLINSRELEEPMENEEAAE